ncbi:hypothetical protein CAFE_20550 [Caprobacter fermentans]|uniref:Uncharacterized protein n=1 Tax=Caproicibacter fermentans TaxID=2576756 RepID=A0A6N8I014_9FIRM|nr:hypothetical protein [Caproicibacter fermentans]MVB11342.1 hypothetical protein [Caproicibacter fermentans]
MNIIQNKHLSIGQIKKIEPRINRVLNDAAHIQEADWPDYSRFKQRLIPLVGYYCKNESLQTSEAYDIVISALCKALKI